MIVCICNNVNTTTIEAAVENGATSLEEIRNCTGAGACCGKCQFKVNRVLQDTNTAVLPEAAAMK